MPIPDCCTDPILRQFSTFFLLSEHLIPGSSRRVRTKRDVPISWAGGGSASHEEGAKRGPSGLPSPLGYSSCPCAPLRSSGLIPARCLCRAGEQPPAVLGDRRRADESPGPSPGDAQTRHRVARELGGFEMPPLQSSRAAARFTDVPKRKARLSPDELIIPTVRNLTKTWHSSSFLGGAGRCSRPRNQAQL